MSKYPLVNGGDGAPAELPAATTLNVNAGVTGGASLNIPCASGVAPMSPVDGDLWCTPSGMFLRVGSSTVGPFGAGATPGGTSGQIQWNNAGAFDGFTMGGDATLDTSTGDITVTKTSGVAFGYFAIGTDAANLTGTVSVNRFNSGTGASSSTYLSGAGTWTTPAGTGTVTTTGSPANGNLTKFSGPTSITNGDLSGDVATSGTLATTIQANAVTTSKIADANVTLAKIANASANSVLVGSGASGSGASYREIALGSGVAMTGTTLSATGSGGTVTHTAGALTLNQLVVGNGSADIKVSDLTGDITTAGGVATTLATVNSSPGTYAYADVTVNAKGLVTAASAGTAPPAAANPTATASDSAVNGTATTFMRSDAAPAIQKTSSSVFGLCKVDNTTITASGGVISSTGGAIGANPTATAGPSAVNGSATTFLRSDGAPAVQIGSASQKGILQVDGSTIISTGGVISASGTPIGGALPPVIWSDFGNNFSSGANRATVGATMVPYSAFSVTGVVAVISATSGDIYQAGIYVVNSSWVIQSTTVVSATPDGRKLGGSGFHVSAFGVFRGRDDLRRCHHENERDNHNEREHCRSNRNQFTKSIQWRAVGLRHAQCIGADCRNLVGVRLPDHWKHVLDVRGSGWYRI